MKYRITLAILILSLTSGALPAAERWPSSELLLPCFEVRLEESASLTTFLAVVNAGMEAEQIRISVLSNWGIEVLAAELVIGAHEVRSINLFSWIVDGRSPDGSILDPALSEEIVKSLCGLEATLAPQLGPMFYSELTEFDDPLRGVGSVKIQVLADPAADTLWGDFFIFDRVKNVAHGEVLANLDPLVEPKGDNDDDICPLHAFRFLEGGAFDNTTFMVWNPLREVPSELAYFPDEAKVPATLTFYDELGTHLATVPYELRPFEQIIVEDVRAQHGIDQEFGWIKVDTDELDTFVTVEYSALDHYTVAMETFCLKRDPSGASIDLEKYINGADADTRPGLALVWNLPVVWSYVVTNTGAETLTGIELTDSDSAIGTVSCPKDVLEPGQSMTCDERHGFARSCAYRNVGRVVGIAPDGTVVEDTDPTHYYLNPRVTLTKCTRPQGSGICLDGPVVDVGSPVTWEYTVTNTGGVTLSDIAVTDSQGVAVSCPQTTLAIGDPPMTCTAGGTAVRGRYENLGTVTARSDCGPVTDSDSSYYDTTWPDIDLEKHTNDVDADVPPGVLVPFGSTVTWTYIVANTGDVPLANVTVTDTRIGTISCPQTTLAVNAVMTCSAQGIAVAGQYDNLGTATGQSPSGTTVTDTDPSHYYTLPDEPDIHLEKHTNGQDADVPTGPVVEAGAAVIWEYFVTNTGNVPLANVTVTDSPIGAISCPQTTLAVGAAMTCSAQGTAVAGQYDNLGTATGQSPQGTTVSDTDPSHYLGVVPEIRLEKHTNGADADLPTGPVVEVGSTVVWNYFVTNTGGVALANVTVTDGRIGPVSCPQTTLAISASMTCSAQGTAVAGQYDNLGTATGQSPLGTMVTDTDPSHYLGVVPEIKIEKHTNGQDADTPTGPQIQAGSPVTWDYLVSNTGGVALANVTVTDSRIGPVNCPQTALAVSASMTCTAQGTATCGQYDNVGTATGQSPLGTTVSDSDPSHYLGIADPAIVLVKYVGDSQGNWWNVDSCPDNQPDFRDKRVWWRFEVTNTGNVTLYNVKVEDPEVVGPNDCFWGQLPASHTVTCGPFAKSTQIDPKCHCRCNEASVHGDPPCDLPQVSDSDTSCYYQ